MKQYELCGFLNMFDIIPDFVYPIFQNDNIFYFQDGENDKIDCLVPVKPSVHSMICKVNDFENIIGIKNETITINSRPLYAFQVNENEIVCGNAELILDFFDSYVPNNSILKEEIEDLKTDLRISLKNYKIDKITLSSSLCNDKKYEYINKWNSRLFLHLDNNIRPLTLADTFIIPDYKIKKSAKKLGFSSSDTFDRIIDKFAMYNINSTMLISGVPGIGKSSVLAWISSKYKDDERFVILKFRDWSEEELKGGLLKGICNTLKCKEKELENKILMLDGFDEIKLLNVREELLLNFFNDIKDFNNFKCVITSRPSYIYSEYFQNIVELLPLSYNNLEVMYKKISGTNVIPIEITNKLKGCHDICDILGIPIILYMAIMSNIDINKNTSEPELYNRIFAREYGIFDQFLNGEIAYSSGSQTFRNRDNIEKYLIFLQEIAFEMFEKNSLVLSMKEFVNPIFEFQDYSMNILDFPIKYLLVDTEANIEFIHKSVYEFFVAEYIFFRINKAISHNMSLEQFAGILGKILKMNKMSKEILEFLKYRIRNSRLNDAYDIISKTFDIMLRDGMTFYTKECYKNVIKCEMCIFSNMLEIMHIWENHRFKFDDSVRQYLYYNIDWDFKLNLENVDLDQVNLVGTNLREANLKGANLRGIDLKAANLTRANLCGANLQQTDLGGVDLRKAELVGTNLETVNLLAAVIDESQIEYIETKCKSQGIRVFINETREIISYEEFCNRRSKKYS